MADKTLKEFQEEAIATFKNYQNTGTPPWDYSITARDLPYQVGSLTKSTFTAGRDTPQGRKE